MKSIQSIAILIMDNIGIQSNIQPKILQNDSK